jgi:hypothetical protein
MKTILSRLRKLENGHLPPVETEAGRRVREANERLCRRMTSAEARMKAMGYESPELQMRELTANEPASHSGLSLGQMIRYHTQRRRDWMAEIGLWNTTGRSSDAIQS